MRTFMRLMTAALLTAVCASQGGCVTTALWNDADAGSRYFEHLDGFLVGAGGRPESAVVAYTINGFAQGGVSSRRYAVLPLDPTAGPFAYAGPTRSPRAIAAEMGEARLAAALAPGAVTDWRSADVLKSPAYREAGYGFDKDPDRPPAGNLWVTLPFDVSSWDGEDKFRFRAVGRGPRPPPLGPDDGARWRARRPTTGPAAGDGTFVVVVAPFAAARSPAERRGAKTRAVLLTPLALAADVVVTPLYPVYGIFALMAMGHGS